MKSLRKLIFLFALVSLLGCQKDEYNFDDLPETVKGYFTVEKTDYEINDLIKFTNASENTESYSWDFGDGTKSTEKDPVKSYAEEGIYTVVLTAVGPGGTGRYSMDISVIDPSLHAGQAKDLFFIEYGNELIKKISLEPGSTDTVIADISGFAGVGMAYDSLAEKIYFSDFENSGDGKIWRMNLDGSGLEKLVEGIDDPYSVALNLKDGKVYWADDAGNVGRANLDGTNVEREFIHVEGGQMRAIDFDGVEEIIYFYEVYNEDLYAAKADGTGISKIVSGAYGYGIYVDEVNRKIYYEDRNVPAIFQADLDGSGAVKIADVPRTRVHGMAVDHKEGKFYWANRDNGTIVRANLDGTGIENFKSGLRSPRGLFIK